MGYYSDVYVRMKNEDVKEYLDEYNGKDYNPTSSEIFDMKDGTSVLVFEFIKWYGDSVKKFQKWMEERPYAIIEVGEEMVDCDWDSNDDFMQDGFYPCVTINFDTGIDPERKSVYDWRMNV